MTLFKDRRYTWWQIGVFKLALLALGVAIGAYWADLFLPYLTALVTVGVASSLYITLVSFRQ